MTPRGDTPSHFRFSLVLFFVFLLMSPTQASRAGKSCVAGIAFTLNSAEIKPFQLVNDLVDCLNNAKKTYSEIRGIIKQLPEVIDKVLPVAWTVGLVLLSMYFVCSSFSLYNEAKILQENANYHLGEFKALEKEVKMLKDFIDTKLIPQWKQGNTANVVKTTEGVLVRIGRYSAVLQQLTQAVREDIKKGRSNQRWYPFVAGGVFFLCVGSVLARPTPPPSFSGVSILSCPASIATAIYSCCGYCSVSDTLPVLEFLEKHETTMAQELTRYQSKLYLAKMEHELSMASD